MDPNNPAQNGQNPNPAQPNPALRPMNEPHIPITEDEMNHQMHQNSPRSGINTLLTLSSLLVLSGVIGVTLWLYIQNRTTQNTQQANNTAEGQEEPGEEPIKEIAGIKVVGAENIKKVEKYGAICKRFTSLEMAISEAEVACELDLSNQELESLPEEVLKLKNLTSINLSDNNFSEFPEELLSLQALLTIDLSNNNITSIPEGLNFNSIQNIELAGNNLDSEEISNYRKITPPPPTPTKTKINNN